MVWVSIKFLFLSFVSFLISWPLCDFSHAQIRISFCVALPWSSPLFSFTVWLTHTHTHTQVHTFTHTLSLLSFWQNKQTKKSVYPPSSHLPPIATQIPPPPFFYKLSHTPSLHLLPCSLPLDAHIHTNPNAWRDVVIMNEATSFWAQGYKAIKQFGVLHGKTFVKPEEQTVLPTGGLNLNSARP